MSRAGSEAVIGQTQCSRRPSCAMARDGSCRIGISIGALDPARIVIAPPTLAGWHDVPLIETRPAVRDSGWKTTPRGARRMAIGAGRGGGSWSSLRCRQVSRRRHREGHLYHGRRACRRIGMTITGEATAASAASSAASSSGFGNCARARHRRDGDGRRSLLRRLAADGDISARHVIEAARTGDKQALACR
jgi:glucokinase